jgi:hypothetical protein
MDLLNFIRPPEDASWKTVNRWRWNVALSLMGLAACAILAYSPYGFAWSGEVDKKIEAAIEAKIQPILVEQQAQKLTLESVRGLLIEQLATTKAAQIRLNISKRCKTSSDVDREELARERDRLQGEYRALKAEYYREPSCGEL